MKKLTLIISVLVFLVYDNSFGQSTYVLLEQDTCRLKINGLSILDLNMTGVNFEQLAAFGTLQDSTYTRTFVDETWELTYPGLSLTFINLDGKPKLYQLVITSFDEVAVEFCQKRIYSHSAEVFDFKGNSKEKIQVTVINDNTTEAEKFGNGYNYLEMILDSKKHIKSLRFQDSGQ